MGGGDAAAYGGGLLTVERPAQLGAFTLALKACPLVASVQAPEGSPLRDPETLAQLAMASESQGVRCYRVEGVAAIRAVRKAVNGLTIGLIKRQYPKSEVVITPTKLEVSELLETDCEAIAFDATVRKRPSRDSIGTIIEAIHRGNRVAMADCDTPDSVNAATAHGADVVSTTLSGYTGDSPMGSGPDLDLVRYAVAHGAYAVAEGRFTEPWQARAALRIGAKGVVVGGALNDPTKQTRRFASAMGIASSVGAVDLGGTWLRFGSFGPGFELNDSKRIRTPASRPERLKWIAERASKRGLRRIGISAGGTIDPITGGVVESKPLIPEHRGTYFEFEGRIVFALNDGLATAWGHAQLPELAGRDTATLALGTGVGCGMVTRGSLVYGPVGEYPRLNDLPFEGGTIEEALGGSGGVVQEDAIRAACYAVDLLRSVFLIETVVICGGVGLSEWMREGLRRHQERGHVVFSPFGEDAGLYGAAALALWPPDVFEART